MGFKNLFVAPSTQSFLEEARKMRGYSLFDFIHGYIYARWPYLHIGIGVGTHPLTKWLAPFGGWINKLITKQKPDESNDAQIGFADTYHGKTVPLATAKQLVLINEPIQIPDLEQIIPYQQYVMRLVVDTSILISSLIKRSVTREILLLPFMKFYLPEYALEELEAHKPKLSKLSGLSIDEIDILLNSLLDYISIVPAQTIQPYLKEAESIIGSVDPGDVPFCSSGPRC